MRQNFLTRLGRLEEAADPGPPGPAEEARQRELDEKMCRDLRELQRALRHPAPGAPFGELPDEECFDAWCVAAGLELGVPVDDWPAEHLDAWRRGRHVGWRPPPW